MFALELGALSEFLEKVFIFKVEALGHHIAQMVSMRVTLTFYIVCHILRLHHYSSRISEKPLFDFDSISLLYVL